MGIDDVVGWLACPVCRAALHRDGSALACADGHRFDVARQGHVNLLRGAQPPHADTPAMVASRLEFLGRGHYDALADAVVHALVGTDGDPATSVLDAGSGPGFYLARALDAEPGRHGLAADISVAAIRRAAKAHPRMGAVVADTWQGLPVRDGAVDAVTCVFAPRNAAEFARVLQPSGTLVVAAPGPDHLREARAALGLLDVPADKHERLVEQMSTHFAPLDHVNVRRTLRLDAAELTAVVDMGPNAFHRHAVPDDGLEVTLDVRVARFRPLGA